MTSIVISPFWQSFDEQWVGATLVALTAMILLSATISLVRARSVNRILITVGLIVLAALLLAPKADSQSPKMFQIWLMDPSTLTSLSILQILITTITVFGSLRQEFCIERQGQILHEIRSWFIAVVGVLPSPILLVFIFWIEQNMMISTRQTAPIMIGIQVAVVLVVILAMLAFILAWFGKYQLIAIHFFVGFALVCSGALLPCLTIKLSFHSTSGSQYMPDILPLVGVLILMAVTFVYGFYRAEKRSLTH
ncbi:MAG: hypothetical protein LBC20_09190 [Planctomycetaceae bacterium]|jgi:hypothetical protein|nr:hypothetical protein [Planctomycetaceae bacterium]